jgi:hypothetical protein
VSNVSPAIRVRPEVIATAIAQVREILDAAEECPDVVASAYIHYANNAIEQGYAWMMAAILIAQTAEVDSMTLRNLQTRIWKGSQDVIF